MALLFTRVWRRKTILFKVSEDRDREACHEITRVWKKENEKRQRQLAITRDHVAIDDPSPSNLLLLGRRIELSSPCCFQALSLHPGDVEAMSQLVEKALNYRHLPGGQSGTSDYSFVEMFDYVLEYGVRYINGGDLEGGTEGLAHHKLRLSFGKTIYSYGLTFDFETLDREKYRIGME